MKSRYTLYGYVVSKVGIPMARKALKKRARNAPRDSARAAKNNAGKASVLAGSALGAALYLVKRRRGDRSGD